METTNNTPVNISGQLIDFKELQSIYAESQLEARNAKVAELLAENKAVEAIAFIKDSEHTVLAEIFKNKTYVLVELEGKTYFAEVPDKVSLKIPGTSSNTKTNSYPYPFEIGDMIQLKSGNEVDKEVYEVTSQGLKDTKGNFYSNKSKITIGGLVERFHTGTLGKSASKKGMAGITHNYWHKIEVKEPAKTN